MSKSETIEIMGRKVSLDRLYDRKTHMWLQQVPDGSVRCGLDSLAADSYGDIVAVSFVQEGSLVAEGKEFGSLEAAKYVGPLVLPIAGEIERVNVDVSAQPGVVRDNPYESWLVQVRIGRQNTLGSHLIDAAASTDELREWWESETRRMKEDGVLSE